MSDTLVWVGGMPWPQTGATLYHAQLGLTDKGCAISQVVCNNLDLEPLDLINGLALGCYQPSPEVLIVLYIPIILKIFKNYILASSDCFVWKLLLCIVFVPIVFNYSMTKKWWLVLDIAADPTVFNIFSIALACGWPRIEPDRRMIFSVHIPFIYKHPFYKYFVRLFDG